MKRDVDSPKAYLAAVDEPQRAIVQRIRKALKKAVPGIEESIRYGMLDYPGLANLGAQKHYVALYVAPVVLADHKKHFPGVDAGKSCLRFRRLDQVDAKALDELLAAVRDHRAAEGGA